MENNNGGSFRKKKVYFSQVSNTALRDENLTLKAKGLYSLIQSYITLENFTLYKNTLMKQCKEGRDGFNSAWKELKKVGYLVQYKIKNENGTYNYEYELLDEPCTENPHTEKPHLENPHTENTYIYNTNSNNTDLNNTNSTCSSSVDLIKEFELNICELKKTTRIKFEEVINRHDSDFVLSILEQCCNSNIKSYAGFEKVFNSYLERNCNTRESVEKATNDYRMKHTKKNIKPCSKADKGKKTNFDNFEAREYDYDDLEKKLLGWDKEE